MTDAVVHVVVAGEVGGAERMLVDLASGATSRRHAVALFTPNDRLRALFRDARLTVHDRGAVREDPVSYLMRSLGPADVRWLGGVLAKERAAVVHLHTFGSQVLGTRAALRAGLPVVRTEHSTRVYDDPSCWPFSRWSLKRTARAVCISAHVRDVAVAKARWVAARAVVVPNGIDVERFAAAPLPAPMTNGHLRALALGRLDRRKGLDVLLAAVAKTPNVDLEIVGDGPEKDALVALAARLGVAARVRFTGYVDDVRDAIARADVLVSSARTEGLGVALLEGMAMGRPVVALPTGGIPEFVEDGRTGWLAARGGDEAAQLARALESARTSDRAPRAAEARARVVERFSRAAMRDGYERIYEAAISEGRRTRS